MGTIYKAGDGTIFECKLWHEVNGTHYALDTTNITEILAYPLYSLANLGESFNFISRYLPGYSQDKAVTALDDLECLIDNECDDDKLESLTELYGSDKQHWVREREALYLDLLNEAIKAYKKKKYEA